MSVHTCSMNVYMPMNMPNKYAHKVNECAHAHMNTPNECAHMLNECVHAHEHAQ